MSEEKSPPKTDVVLVVKGAGVHKPDDTLDQFLKGFWPAITKLDEEATITQRQDVLGPDYQPSPHDKDPHKHVTEIHCRGHRIWVKEAYWEPELTPAEPFGVLLKEWRMATYALGNLINRAFIESDTRKREQTRKRKRYSPRYFFSYLLLYFSIFWLFFILPVWKYTGAISTTSFLVTLLAAAIWAIPPTIETYKKHAMRAVDRMLESLPGMGGWVLLPLTITLLICPIEYFLVVLVLLGVQLTLNLSRAILWEFRIFDNSDTDLADYYSYHEEIEGEQQYRIGKFDKRYAKIFMMPLFYRYIVLLLLPVSFIGYGIVQLLNWTRILSGVGTGLDRFLNLALSSILGDVVTYAMDPAQAHRIRSVIANDIAHFSKRKDVDRIHIFAHSQGTAITYETLFRDLTAENQQKIQTYITIGSILSYYNQAKEVLDPIYVPRFPVLTSKEQHFAEGFRWMNFWNFTDPITEFYGLDEYTRMEKAPPLQPDGRPKHFNKNEQDEWERTRTSPRNIRSRASLKNHSEYWTNLDEIHIPFVKRILGELRPTEWSRDQRKKLRIPHHGAVFILWVIFLLVLILIGAGVIWLSSDDNLAMLNEAISPIQALIKSVTDEYSRIFPPQEETLGDQLQKAAEFFASKPVQNLRRLLLNIAIFVVPVLAITDWFRQFNRAMRIGKKLKKED